MTKLFEIAAKISSQWSLAAFAIIALVFLILKMQKRKIPAVVWAVVVAIVIIALAPIVAPAYLNSYGIYRVRVVVLDERQMPTNDAKVTCSVGGEVKKVEGGWECDIPTKTSPADHKLQVYASIPNAFLSGHVEAPLNDDYSPVITVPLGQETSARILGMVIDENNVPVEGAQVGVVGYEAEALVTQKGGNFSLPAHKANGQQVQIYANKKGYAAIIPEWHQAGNHPVVITLQQQRPSKHKHV